MFRLLRHFTAMSALATAAITTVLVLGFYIYEMRNLNQLVEDRNTAQAYNFANVLLPGYASHFDQPLATPADVLRAQPATQRLHADLRQLTQGLPILKVKIYNRAGLTIYSSDPRQIGEDRSADELLQRSFSKGLVISKIGSRDVLNSFEGDFRNREVAEAYIPIRDGTGSVPIAIELYADVTAYVNEVERGIATVTGMLVLALGLLFVMLLLVVRRADKILVRQYGELESFSSRLEQKVEERTRGLLNQQSVLSWITRSEEFRSGNFEVAIRNLTRITATTLGVDRVSVWMFSSQHDVLRCIDLYSSGRGDHVGGQAIACASYPRYFEVLMSQECLSFDDARNDERLMEFRQGYLAPLNIGSMLDVPIVNGGRVEGVLCIEHVGEPVKWSAEQRLFAIAIANFASLAVERQERLRAEDDLRAANRSVEAANRAKSLFLANMSHEIRTPMNGVFGMTDLLMRTELTDRQRKFVGIIAGSAKRLLTIINDILDLSRIESGKLELDREDFALRASVEETIDLLATEAQRKGLDLSVHIARDVPAIVSGDSGRLRQVITNIASNAIKFTNAGEVAVRVGCNGHKDGMATVTFEVRDTGIGITEDMQQRLFAPFQQADTSISRRFGGTGLGLSISRHLIELMGGRIELSSTAGKGTTVRFVLDMPVKEGTAVEQHDGGILIQQRVLVLDDRATNREVVESYFADCKANVSCAASAREAYEALVQGVEQGRPIALVVVDMVMPDVNGLEFAQMVRANPMLAKTQMIMLTSLSWKGDARVARELGFGAFLTKPVHRSDLVRTAQQLLANQHAGLPPSDPARSESTTTSEQPTVEAPALRGLHVLIAEDNPVNIEVACEYLTGMGCRVSTAENGQLALDAMRGGRFDVVLMDCQMPEMDGLTATREIRRLERESNLHHTPIIALTANAFAEDRALCMEAGMDDYMSKPFAEEQLRALLLRWAPAVAPTAVGASPAAPASTGAGPRPAPAAAPQRQPGEPVLGAAAVPVTPAAVASAVNLEQMRGMQKSHPTLAGRLVDTYLGYAPKAMQQLLAALVAEDNKQLMTTAHSLKSSSANIGAVYLSDLCRTLEARLKTATEWDGGANLAAVAEIETAFQAVAVALGDFQAELRAAAPAARASA